MIGLGAVNNDFITNQGQLGRRILADGLKLHFRPVDLERQQRHHPLDPLQHARGKRRQQQLNRVHRILTPGRVSVQNHLRALGGGKAAVVVGSAGMNMIFHGSALLYRAGPAPTLH